MKVDTVCSIMQLVNYNEEGFCNCEEAEPLNFQAVEEESDGEMDVSLWVHQNIIKLSKEFGVEFEGCKKEVLALFKKIDRRRHSRNIESEWKTGESTKVKGIQELKGLMTDMKFQSKGTRNRGRGKALDI